MKLLAVLAIVCGIALAHPQPEAFPAAIGESNLELRAVDDGSLNITDSDAVPTAGGGTSHLSCLFTAYSKFNCNGGFGNTDGLEHSCVDCRGRHSFFLSRGCAETIVTVFKQPGCDGGFSRTRVLQGGRCYNVNNGKSWSSTHFEES